MELDMPIGQLSRVGASTVRRLHKLGITTIQDLLYHFPFRYDDFRQAASIKDLHEGESIIVRGTIELIATRRTPRKRLVLTEALVSDASGSLRVVWFNQPYISKSLQSGDTILLSGTVKADMLGCELVNPGYEKVSKDSVPESRLVPVYSVTQGLTQKQLRGYVQQAMKGVAAGDWLPDELLSEYDLVPLQDALRGIHHPVDKTDLAQAERRLKFDELFMVQLRVEAVRRERKSTQAPSLVFKEKEIKYFVEQLPFALTKAQKVAAWEILQNTGADIPMNRLLSGDVGSGKTVVAAMALYNTALNGYQAAIMAPTEILATQHFTSLQALLPEVPIALWTRTQHCIAQQGSVKQFSKKELAEQCAAGKMPVIVGTHALITEGVQFRQLGLVIVDEQHRFGVAQRQVMKEKGKGVHFLSMTATPIPRSLALMLYGDLDISIINEMPAGRKKIITRVVEAEKRSDAYAFIRKQVNGGRQVFVVCPLIEESMTAVVEKKSVMVEYEKLSKTIFPDLKVGFLHGKMKPAEKEEIMSAFKSNQLHILVATSVIEVGVNIPNATVMMIEGADRFGLAQLHQFRGRVGRSDHQAYCLLFTDSESPRSKERLAYFENHHDGFKLAEKDLEMRGAGQLYGTMQSGLVDLKLATLSDAELLKQTREAAKKITPQLERYPVLKLKLEAAGKAVHLE